MIGRTLSHFEITARLGAGGMGEVYLAEDTKLGRRVALKVLPAEVADDPERLARLQREARSLAALDHPNIVSVYSIEESDGVHFLTMAYVEGRTLDEMIPEEGLQTERLLELAAPLVDALRAAHDRGIVHRDLKPANVMVDGEGRLRVLDFGIAKQLGPSGDLDATDLPTQTMTELGTVLGTYPYMSPEQAEGKPADARSDIFSLGVVLYQMATGRRPFRGDTPAALISSILKDRPAPLSATAAEVPAGLERIVGRCLEKEPENRYQGADELRRDLDSLRREVAAGRAEQARPAVPPGLAASVWRRLAVVALLAAIVVLGAVVLWRSRADPAGGAGEISALAVLPLQNRTGDPEQEYFVDGMTEALITDLSKIGALKVTSRSASMRYKGSEEPLPEIARELGVEALVEGQVLREGDRVSIRAQLIDAATESNLWGDSYTRDLTSVLELQSELARAIAREIRVTLTPEEERLLTAERPVDPEAYEAYLKGMSHWNELTPANIDTAQQYFELALDRDPGYAPAHAGIAMVWGGRQQMGLSPPAVAGPAAKAAAERAVELDPELSDGHAALAVVHAWVQWDWDAAVAEFERALEIKPNDPHTLAYYAHVLVLLGRPEEAIARAEEALERDPFNSLYRSLYGIVLNFTGRNEEALDAFTEALRIVPGHPVALDGLWATLEGLGRLEEAYEAARDRFTATGELELAAALERGWAEGGYRAAMREAARTLEERPRDRFLPALLAAAIQVAAGRTEAALDWMERGLEIRDPSLPYLAVAPAWPELQGKPRYEALVRAVNLDHGRW